MKYLPHSITLVMFSKEKHDPIKLQKIEIGAKFENLNKIWLISHSIPPDIINYVVKKISNILELRILILRLKHRKYNIL